MPKPRYKKKTAQNIPTTRVSVIVIDAQKILLVKHRKGNHQYWVLPGGRLEYGETFIECGIRELKEETGLEIEIEKFLYLSEAIAPDRSRHIVNIYLQGKVIGGTLCLGEEPVLAGVDFIPLVELSKATIFPPIGQVILNSLPMEANKMNTNKGIEYLGNLWV